VDSPAEALLLLQKTLGPEDEPQIPAIAKSRTPDDPAPEP
jgi:hypothetical protein